MNEEEYYDDYDYTINVRIEDIKLMHHCEKETIKYWLGAPARPYEEQEQLWALRDNLFKIMLEDQFNNS